MPAARRGRHWRLGGKQWAARAPSRTQSWPRTRRPQHGPAASCRSLQRRAHEMRWAHGSAGQRTRGAIEQHAGRGWHTQPPQVRSSLPLPLHELHQGVLDLRRRWVSRETHERTSASQHAHSPTRPRRPASRWACERRPRGGGRAERGPARASCTAAAPAPAPALCRLPQQRAVPRCADTRAADRGVCSRP